MDFLTFSKCVVFQKGLLKIDFSLQKAVTCNEVSKHIFHLPFTFLNFKL